MRKQSCYSLENKISSSPHLWHCSFIAQIFKKLRMAFLDLASSISSFDELEHHLTTGRHMERNEEYPMGKKEGSRFVL